jgi:anti-sigma regulatory factor (Ser/Thr protein kinase)
VARRAGVDKAQLDEVRLAVGEACTRAVGLHMSNSVSSPVRVSLIEAEKKFSIEVGDEASGPVALVPGGRDELPEPAGEDDEADGDMGLAVISGLVDDVEITSDDQGGLIRMSWPAHVAQPVLP